MVSDDLLSEAGSQLRHMVALSGRILYQQGLVDYLGHSSARVPKTDRIVIKPRSSVSTRGLFSLTAEDMLVVDFDGKVVSGEGPPPSEVFIHTQIYDARPDVGAIVHTHQPSATLLGIVGGQLHPILHVPSVLCDGGTIGTWACPLLVVTTELGTALAEALGEANMCHMQGHGIVAVAPDVETATVRAIALEQLAAANLRVLQTGLEARVISKDELEALRTDLAPVAGRWAYYEQLLGTVGSGGCSHFG